MTFDMAATTAPKSDQINADDLIGGPRTITVTRVSANEATPEQPVNVFFEGDGGKPFRPCKSMRRVMVAVWGADAAAYVGRSMTLYRDPEVAFGGMKVGGIRISHMSHIERDMTLALTATRAQRKPFTVRPLVQSRTPPAIDAACVEARKGTEPFRVWWRANADKQAGLKPHLTELQTLCAEADKKAATDANPFSLPPLSDPEADRLAAEARADSDRLAMEG